MDHVVSGIVELYQREMVIRFGSFANGNVHGGSDLDPMLIEQTNEPLNFLKEPIFQLLYKNNDP